MEYINSSIEIFIDMRLQERLENMKKENMNKSYESIYDEDGVNEYEKMLRKIEGENRNHIKVRKYQQLKII